MLSIREYILSNIDIKHFLKLNDNLKLHYFKLYLGLKRRENIEKCFISLLKN